MVALKYCQAYYKDPILYPFVHTKVKNFKGRFSTDFDSINIEAIIFNMYHCFLSNIETEAKVFTITTN